MIGPFALYLARCRCLVASLLTMGPTLPALAQVQFLGPAVVEVPMAIGTVAPIAFTLRNPGAKSVTAQLQLNDLPTLSSPYRLTSTGPCAVPILFPPTPSWVQIGAGLEATCTFAVERRTQAFGDESLRFRVSPAAPADPGKTFHLGDLTRLEIQQAIARFAQPGVPGLVRLTVHNRGPTAVQALDYRACILSGGSLAMATLVVAGECQQIGPDGCGPDGSLETGFAMAQIPVGGSLSCLFEATAGVQVPLPLSLSAQKPGGGRLLNTNPVADVITIRGAVGAPRSVPAVGSTWLIVLVLLLVLSSGLIGLTREQPGQ